MKGHIRPKGEGVWLISIFLGRDGNGKQLRKYATVRGTIKEAEKEKVRLLHELHTGTLTSGAKMTVGQYLERWLKDYAQVKVGTKTFHTYSDFVRLHLKPALGRHKLDKLQPLHIQAYYTEALLSGRKDGQGGLSPQTVLHHHRCLRTALQQAVRWQLIPRNPADFVEAPTVKRDEPPALDEKQTAELLKVAEGSRIYLPALLAVTTSMRRGEICALRWSAVKLSVSGKGADRVLEGTVTVREALGQSKAGLEFKEPKCESSRRTIELGSLLVEALLRHRGEQAQEKLLMGEAYEDQDLVFAHPNGHPYQPDWLSKQFTKLAKQAGTDLRLHGLRHSHISQLLKLGVSINVVARRAGHSDPAMTLRTYGHVLPGMDREAAGVGDGALRAALGGLKSWEQSGTG